MTDKVTTQIFAIHINKSYSTLEVYNNNVFFPFTFCFYFKRTTWFNNCRQLRQDEQLIFIYCYTRNQTASKEREIRASEIQEQRQRRLGKKNHTIHHCHPHGHGWNVDHGGRNVGCVSLAECSSLLFLRAHSEVAKTNSKQCRQRSARTW